MSEKGLWNTMRVKMHGVWEEATRHEDSLAAGIADVSFVNRGRHGWMELKKLDAWPVRESTIVRIPHYTDFQRIWLEQKGRAGGHTWLFLKVGRDYLLFDWERAQRVGYLTKRELISHANRCWLGKMYWYELGALI